MEEMEEQEPEKPCEPCLTYVTHHAAYNAKQCKSWGKRMTGRALLQACERTLSGFVMEALNDVSCDDYAASVLPSFNVVHPYDVIFVEQVLYGCCRYNKLLSILVSSLLKCKAGCTQRGDDFLYSVLGYLILIRLDELTFPNLCLLILSQHAQKMLPFVQFILSTKYLTDYCKAEWLKVYDTEFIDELINNIGSWSTEAAELETKVAGRVFIKDLRDGRRTTPKPFNLSVSTRPKPEPRKEELPAPYKANRMPKFRPGPTSVQKAMETVRVENRKRQAEFYANPNYQPFRLRSLERPTNIEEIREEVERRRALEHEYIPAKVNSCPDLPSKEIKLTAAAVLREHALYQKQVEADKRRVRAFEAELRDEASFKAWQEEERARHDLGQALQAQFRRESVAAIVQAIQDAKQTLVKSKHEMADDVRQETQLLSARKEEFKLSMELVNGLKHEAILQDRGSAKEAVNKVAEGKKSRASEIQQQSLKHEHEMSVSQATELRIKQELVRQLRALEMEYVRDVKRFDPDTAYDHGLLDEMSITELKQRLELMKFAFERERESRRNNIMAVKEERRNSLLGKAQFVRTMREVTRIEQTSKREAKKRSGASTAKTLAALEAVPSPPPDTKFAVEVKN